jgi:hypothetical protein
MHMLIYEQNRCLLMDSWLYLTPAPRNGVGVGVLLLDGCLCLPYFSSFDGDGLLHQSLLNSHQFLVEL